ncbi:MAG: hypothetical protein QOC77_2679 [Thermoleophilaceae bacterium]|jgi:hypothetical protein|nr:hypothetical protein [Thermoleophilaceae bacterium]
MTFGGGDRVQELQLTAEQRNVVEESIAAHVAVQLYRQFRLVQENPELAKAADSSGCNIIGNCSSCSKLVALER